MRALVIEPLPTTKGIIPVGQIIEIPPAILEKLRGDFDDHLPASTYRLADR